MGKKATKKKAAAKKESVANNIENEKKIAKEPPLEDKPLSMQSQPEEISDKSKNNKSPFLLTTKTKQIKAKPTIPTHYQCGGGLMAFGSDGVGIWWDCQQCRSQFYNRSSAKVGPLGNPKDKSVTYKINNMPRRSRRLT